MWTSFDEGIWLCAKVLYLALPVMAAGAVHIVVLCHDLWPVLKVPIDFGSTFRGRRIFGAHKTWRGVVVMVGGAWVAMLLQQALRMPSLELFDYGEVPAGLAGALLGLGFVVGELPNSFLKRRCGVAPGCQAEGLAYGLFSLLDQVDSVIGGLLALALVWVAPWPVVVAALVLCTLLHVAFNLVFVWVGLKGRAF